MRYQLIFTTLMIYFISEFAQANQSEQSDKLPLNIIFIIGDGMGPAYTSAYRYFNDDPQTVEVEKTVFDRHVVGLSSTYPALISGNVTDSAAGATALSSGIKTYNNAIGVDVDKNPVLTVLEFAKQKGKKTGVVVTSTINHATPASFIAHNESRHNGNEIADSLIDDHDNNQFPFDLLLGGGLKYFKRSDRDLVSEFKQAGFQYIDKYDSLNSLDPARSTLGIFSNDGLPWALDDAIPFRLRTMTQAAITQLENKNGFFMLIEASQIDWGGHSNDIAAAMGEMDDLAKTMEYLEFYVTEHPNTLVIVTADHSTGGLSLAANGVYKWEPEVLRNMIHSPNYIAQQLSDKDVTKARVDELFNFQLTESELASLNDIKTSPMALLASQNTSKSLYSDPSDSEVKKALYSQIRKIIDARTQTGWTTIGHTADDVPVFAFGSNSIQFVGHNDNIDIATKIFSLLGK